MAETGLKLENIVRTLNSWGIYPDINLYGDLRVKLGHGCKLSPKDLARLEVEQPVSEDSSIGFLYDPITTRRYIIDPALENLHYSGGTIYTVPLRHYKRK